MHLQYSKKPLDVENGPDEVEEDVLWAGLTGIHTDKGQNLFITVGQDPANGYVWINVHDLNTMEGEPVHTLRFNGVLACSTPPEPST